MKFREFANCNTGAVHEECSLEEPGVELPMYSTCASRGREEPWVLPWNLSSLSGPGGGGGRPPDEPDKFTQSITTFASKTHTHSPLGVNHQCSLDQQTISTIHNWLSWSYLSVAEYGEVCPTLLSAHDWEAGGMNSLPVVPASRVWRGPDSSWRSVEGEEGGLNLPVKRERARWMAAERSVDSVGQGKRLIGGGGGG